MTTYVDLEDVRMCTRTPYLWGYSWGVSPSLLTPSNTPLKPDMSQDKASDGW